jgi:hypothetical protein
VLTAYHNDATNCEHMYDLSPGNPLLEGTKARLELPEMDEFVWSGYLPEVIAAGP